MLQCTNDIILYRFRRIFTNCPNSKDEWQLFPRAPLLCQIVHQVKSGEATTVSTTQCFVANEKYGIILRVIIAEALALHTLELIVRDRMLLLEQNSEELDAGGGIGSNTDAFTF